MLFKCSLGNGLDKVAARPCLATHFEIRYNKMRRKCSRKEIKVKLSIIIVNYNTFVLTKQTIDSVLCKKHDFNYEIILVDNASSDGSIEALEECFKEECKNQLIHIIKNTDNLGFAKANNIGMRRAKGTYILLLNSDTEVEGSCLQNFLKHMEQN